MGPKREGKMKNSSKANKGTQDSRRLEVKTCDDTVLSNTLTVENRSQGNIFNFR
jgi:hypothetical protein